MPSADEIAQETKRRRALHGLDVRPLHGIELGPLNRPIVRRGDSSVYYVDHCSRPELLIKFQGHALVVPEDIQEVDFIADGRPMAELAAECAPVDYIVASHVIEHVPDLAGWLKDMRTVLCDRGTLVLVVPDKRFTFDVMRREVAFEEVKSAYEEKRKRPGLRCICDHLSNVVQASTWHLWNDYRGLDKLPFYDPPNNLKVAFQNYEAGKYIDVHCWVFTPWSFLELLGDIEVSFGLGFELQYFLTTQSHDLEFYVQLRRTNRPQTDWMAEAEKARRDALWPVNSLPVQQYPKISSGSGH